MKTAIWIRNIQTKRRNIQEVAAYSMLTKVDSIREGIISSKIRGGSTLASKSPWPGTIQSDPSKVSSRLSNSLKEHVNINAPIRCLTNSPNLTLNSWSMQHAIWRGTQMKFSIGRLSSDQSLPSLKKISVTGKRLPQKYR